MTRRPFVALSSMVLALAGAAKDLLALLRPLGPVVEGQSLVLDVPPALEPALRVIHTGVRALLTRSTRFGCGSEIRTAAPRPLNPALPIPTASHCCASRATGAGIGSTPVPASTCRTCSRRPHALCVDLRAERATCRLKANQETLYTAGRERAARTRVMPHTTAVTRVPRGGFGPASSNHYTKSLKAFGNRLVKTRRCAEHPFRHLTRVNANVDVRHQRRALSANEFTRLVAAARAGTTFRRLAGPERAALYLVAGMTGLRASELASLTPASFALDATTPVVVVEAGYSKHRRRDEVPLHPELVAELRVWLSGRPVSEPLWSGKWAKHNEAGDMIRRDLATARAAWIAETDREDAVRRAASDFLTYRNSEGAVADFHALRHTFITNLVNAGVAPKEAKELARHSTITLTMDRYSHVALQNTAMAVSRLTVPNGSRPAAEPPTRAIREQHREQQGAAKSAAEGGDGRERLRNGEEAAAGRDATNVHENKWFEECGGESRAVEGSTPGGTRTHTLPLRRQENASVATALRAILYVGTQA